MAKTKPKSKIWSYCHSNGKRIICKHCGLKMFNNISKFKRHLDSCDKFHQTIDNIGNTTDFR
jgi:hypothetical protein